MQTIREDNISNQVIELKQLNGGMFMVKSHGPLGFKMYTKNTFEKADREYTYLWGNICDHFLGRDANDE